MKSLKNQKRHRIFLVDDHAILRQGLRHLIETDPDMTICGECENGKKSFPRIEESLPELAIVDISLPGMNGIEVIKNLKSRFPKLLTLVLSMHDESLYAERALRAGASGYVMKEASPEVLMEAIRKVLRNEIHVSPKLSSQLLQSLVQNPSRPPLQKLSDRQLEIVQSIGEGMSTSEIAKRLGISSKTVETHRGNIRKKLGLKTGAELIRFAFSNIQN